ncbi:MAG: (d)CMP kinase [Deltaproteobacteria bacterium]|nr:(d)CMP kinase [Deltaproteobacteria bacterium]
MQKKPIIAIDGPVASGKSTVGRMLARKLGFRFLDTGHLYRAVAYLALKLNIAPANARSLIALCHKLQRDKKLEDEGTELISLEREEVSPRLKSEEVSAAASEVAKIPEVRDALVDCQREWAETGGVVMVGRDIGTVIAPDAKWKFYLDASLEERARRRYWELVDRGETPMLETIVSEMKERDRRDEMREAAPLMVASDAMVIDTTEDTVDEVVKILEDIILHGKNSPS